MYLYRELWRHSRGKRLMLAAGMAMLATGQAILLTIPYCAGKAINSLQLDGLDGLNKAFLWLMASLGISAGFWLLHGPGTILARNIAVSIRRRASIELINRLFRLPLAWHTDNHSAASAHRISQSSGALAVFAENQSEYLGITIKVTGPVIALWLINPYVGFAAGAGLCLACLAIFQFERAMIRLAIQKNTAERAHSTALIDALANSMTVNALRQTRSVVAMILRKLEAIFIPFRRTIVINEVKWCAIDIGTRVLACFLVVLFAWLATRARTGGAAPTLMLGSLFMVWEYAQHASSILVEAAAKFHTLAGQHADYRSADPIREARPELHGPVESDAPGYWKQCRVTDVIFRHHKERTESPSINRVSLTLQRGRRYALIGNSGAGKSTLMRVLAGLYVAERIEVAPALTRTIASPIEAARFFRRCATLVPQDAELFEGSLADNLSFCESVMGPPAPEAYADALISAGVDDFIHIGPETMQAPISERAANWSGGQRARVALARGILAARGSALVMLDEPTASLDTVTEAFVYQNIFAEFSDACLIASVHRLHLLPQFDEIIVMSDGRVVAQGSAETLASTSQEYRDLYSGIRTTASA
jgi:ATP-binding cassette subfamily B protein